MASPTFAPEPQGRRRDDDQGQFGTNVISVNSADTPSQSQGGRPASSVHLLHRYKVGAVVFWKGGAYRGVDPSLVHRLFSSALGEPTRVGDHDKMLVWLTNSVQCIP